MRFLIALRRVLMLDTLEDRLRNRIFEMYVGSYPFMIRYCEFWYRRYYSRADAARTPSIGHSYMTVAIIYEQLANGFQDADNQQWDEFDRTGIFPKK